MSVLDRIDNVLDSRCPCGADPREGSAYCGTDCEPTHISDDTEAPDCGTARPGEDYFDPRYAPPTPMRWRPDLVSTADDTDLIPLGSETHGYTGRYNAQVYERVSDPTIWHLRLDDGNLFVGCDLRDVGGPQDPISVELVGRVREAWQRLERKLTDTRDMIPGEDDDPWADVMGHLPGYSARDLLELSRARRRPVVPGHANHAYFHVTRARRSYHNPAAQAAVVAVSGVEDAMRLVGVRMRELAPAIEEYLRHFGVELTEWQRAMVEQMARVQSVAPRMMGRTAQWLPDEVWATVNQPHTAPRPAVPLAHRDEPPEDPMARALWLRKRRNTGPPSDRLDGRRRQRR